MSQYQPYMLPMEPREDSPDVRAAKQRLEHTQNVMGMFGQSASDANSHAAWNVPTQDARTPAYREWADNVPNVMGEKLISAQAVADLMPQIFPQFSGKTFTADEAKVAIGGDYASMNDLIETVIRTSGALQGADIDGPEFDEFAKQRLGEVQRTIATGYGSDSDIGLANLARSTLVQHAPNGKYALYAGRSQEDAEALDAKYGGNSDYYLTPEGQQNHKALRAAEYLSAADHDYSPSTWDAQASRRVASAVQGVGRGAAAKQGAVGQDASAPDPMLDYQTISQPGGRFAHALDMYKRSEFPAEGGEYSVYAPDGRPKYSAYSVMTGPGKANLFLSASNPLGYGTAYLANNAQPGYFIGSAMHKGFTGAIDDNAAATKVRTGYNRITPREIPGVSREDFIKAGKSMQNFDTGMDSYASALYGPLSSDIAKGLLSERLAGQERTYLSPFWSGLINTPGALASDPTNIFMNLALPAGGAVAGAAKAGAGKTIIPALKASAYAGAKGYGAGLARRAMSFTDDVVEEGGVESAAMGLPMGGFFEGQNTNALMGNMPAKDVTVQKVKDAYADVAAKRMDALDPVVEAMNRTRAKPVDQPRSRYGGTRQY